MRVVLRWNRMGEGRENSWAVCEYARNQSREGAQKMLREAVGVATAHLQGYAWEVEVQEEKHETRKQ